MLVIGLTGGIGAGKSTVAQLFAKQGIPIIDADILARTLAEPNKPAFFAIVDHFGDAILQPDQTLDRAQLRERIFMDQNEREWLEALLHPLVHKEILLSLQKLRAKNSDLPYCIVVIPLLFESKAEILLDRILVVDAPEEKQIERAQLRDNLSKTQVLAIMDSQLERERRRDLADDVITNDESMDDLIQQVEQLHTLYSYIATTIY